MKPPNKLAKLLAEAMGDASKSGKLLKQATKTLYDIDFNADMSQADISWVMKNMKSEQLSESQKELLYWSSSQYGSMSDDVDLFLYGPINFIPVNDKITLDDIFKQSNSGKSPVVPLDFEETIAGVKGANVADKQKNAELILGTLDPIEMTKAEIDDITTLAEQIGGAFKGKVDKWLKDGPEPAPNVDVSQYMIGPLKDRTPPTPLDLTPEEAADRVNALLQTGRAADVTEELYGLADPKRLRENYDLPLDPESRQQRRSENWPGNGYHYTSTDKDFSVPNVSVNASGSDAGFHFGTAESARDRAFSTLPNYTDAPRYSNKPKAAEEYERAVAAVSRGETAHIVVGGDIYVVKSMEDINNAFKVSSPVEYPNNARVLPLAYDPSALMQVTDDTGMWTPYAIARSEYDVLKGNPEIKAAMNSLVNEQAQRRTYVNTVPEIARAYGIDTSGNPVAENAIGLNKIEVDEMRKLLDAYGVKGLTYPNRVEGYWGNKSFAAFQPGVVRSTTAIFDPRLKHLGNMMAAGVPLAYGLSDAKE